VKFHLEKGDHIVWLQAENISLNVCIWNGICQINVMLWQQ